MNEYETYPTADHPGKLLRELLEDHNLSQAAFARHIGEHRRTISKVCCGEYRVSAALAVKFSKAFGSSVSFWMNLQNGYELGKVNDREIRVRRLV